MKLCSPSPNSSFLKFSETYGRKLRKSHNLCPGLIHSRREWASHGSSEAAVNKSGRILSARPLHENGNRHSTMRSRSDGIIVPTASTRSLAAWTDATDKLQVFAHHCCNRWFLSYIARIGDARAALSGRHGIAFFLATLRDHLVYIHLRRLR